MPGLRRPVPLLPDHDCSAFESGQPSLDEWLRDRAYLSEGLSARTYVVCSNEEPHRVAGYYAVSAATETRASLPSAKLRRGLPDTVPLLLIGRLALDRRWHGLGLGTDLLVDAMRRCLGASVIVGASGVVVHAIDDGAVAFYRRHGFISTPLGERVLFLPIETIDGLYGPLAD